MTSMDLYPFPSPETAINQDACIFCGEARNERDIVLCDGDCHRSFCIHCLGFQTPPTGAFHCPNCRERVAQCAYCLQKGPKWNPIQPLPVPLDHEHLQDYVIPCSKEGCPNCFHLRCGLAADQPVTTRQVRTRCGSKRQSITRIACPQHRCSLCKGTQPGGPMLGARVKCIRCLRAAHERCASESGWCSISGSKLMLCDRCITVKRLPPSRNPFAVPITRPATPVSPASGHESSTDSLVEKPEPDPLETGAPE